MVLRWATKLRNRPLLQSLHVLPTVETEVIQQPRDFTVGFEKVGVVVGYQTLIGRRVIQNALGIDPP